MHTLRLGPPEQHILAKYLLESNQCTPIIGGSKCPRVRGVKELK